MWEKETLFHHERKFFHNYFLIKNTRKWEWYIIFVFYPNIWENSWKIDFCLSFLQPRLFFDNPIRWNHGAVLLLLEELEVVAGSFVNVSLGPLWNCARFYFMGIWPALVVKEKWLFIKIFAFWKEWISFIIIRREKYHLLCMRGREYLKSDSG